MSDVVISVENLGKKYLIGQQQAQRYTALRDVIAQKIKHFFTERSSHQDGHVVPSFQRCLLPVSLAYSPSTDDFWALKGAGFEVRRGDVVGIIGRNGAGKSTLLKILSRITDPTEGRVRIKGRVASLLEVGTGFHPELTGRENIFLNGAILGMTKAEIRNKFDEIVAFAEIEKFLDTPVKRYSSGMYMRLAFAVAANLESEVLVVDEVLAVGDAQFQKKCLGKMRSASQSGRTVLFVSHNMAAIRSLCSHGVLLSGGRLLYAGTAARAIESYLSRNEGQGPSSAWVRAPTGSSIPVAFSELRLRLIGEQPRITLLCDIQIQCSQPSADTFLAVDIGDQIATPVMQALPLPTPFIKGTPGLHQLHLEIDLPPLVPGIYRADFWVGPHFGSTYDHVRNVLEFEITESPTRERSFPHTLDHGSIVPTSRYSYTSLLNESGKCENEPAC